MRPFFFCSEIKVLISVPDSIPYFNWLQIWPSLQFDDTIIDNCSETIWNSTTMSWIIEKLNKNQNENIETFSEFTKKIKLSFKFVFPTQFRNSIIIGSITRIFYTETFRFHLVLSCSHWKHRWNNLIIFIRYDVQQKIQVGVIFILVISTFSSSWKEDNLFLLRTDLNVMKNMKYNTHKVFPEK